MMFEALVKVEQQVVCPITKSTFEEPVVCCDGQCYEREAIEEWFRQRKWTSPLTNAKLETNKLVPNLALKRLAGAVQKLRPEVEAAERETAALRASLGERERTMERLEARLAEKIDAAEYERVLVLLERAQSRIAELLLLLQEEPVCNVVEEPARGGKPWDDLVSKRRAELVAEAAAARAAEARYEASLGEAEEHAAASRDAAVATACVVDALKSAAGRRRAELVRLSNELKSSEKRRALEANEYLKQAKAMGVPSAHAELEKTRATGEATVPFLRSYARSNVECLSLQAAVAAAGAEVLAAESRAAEMHQVICRARARDTVASERVSDLRAKIDAKSAERCALASTIRRLPADLHEVRRVALWADQATSGFLTPTVENLPMLMLLHKHSEEQLEQARVLRLLVGGHGDAPACRSSGYTAADCRTAGFSVQRCKAMGFTPKELADAGYDLPPRLNTHEFWPPALEVVAGRVITLDAARLAGYSAADFKAAGVDARRLKQAGYAAADLKAAGFSAKECLRAVDSAAECKAAGYDALSLKQAGYGCADLKAAGCSVDELKSAGFGTTTLKLAGFAAAECLGAGFSASDCLGGGYSAQEIMTSGYTWSDERSRTCNVSNAWLRLF
ncbi:hypothetical protein CTAYLR_000387 [Chrysophaeum taylorii]|uniref:U-box domain-containing protein n=1 Tax=Chrysophaeum taylorii TaxID=2483200 RepID=A0AAD7UIA8_9STRA|nr:hypothetical protein CTAYLR_000387 [Chrysophaeum taylorii]